MKRTSVEVKLGIPVVGQVSGTWVPDEAERWAAWELYVELVTRITVVDLPPDQGLLREALSSLHSLFPTTRDILRRYGPAVAPQGKEGGITFGYLAVAILNGVLRALLSTWHPALSAMRRLDQPAGYPQSTSGYGIAPTNSATSWSRPARS
jgi:hypothetical protein